MLIAPVGTIEYVTLSREVEHLDGFTQIFPSSLYVFRQLRGPLLILVSHEDQSRTREGHVNGCTRKDGVSVQGPGIPVVRGWRTATSGIPLEVVVA